MAFLGGLLGGSDPYDLYGDLLNDKQRAALRDQQMGQGLLRMAGAFAEAAKPSLLPTGGIGSALGKAAGALAGHEDEALKGLMTAGQIRELQSKAKLREQLFGPDAQAKLDALMGRISGGAAPTMPPGPTTAGPSGGPNAPPAAPGPSPAPPAAPGPDDNDLARLWGIPGDTPGALPPGAKWSGLLSPPEQQYAGMPGFQNASYGGEAGVPRPFRLAAASSSPGAAGGGGQGAGLSGSAWEIANNNFGGMRKPGVNAGPSQGGFQSFATPEEGLAKIGWQLDRYASGATTGKPLNTVRQIVSTWAPPHENNTPLLINRAARIVGVDPDAVIDVSNPAIKAKLIEATIRNEQGGRLPVDPEMIGAVASNPSLARYAGASSRGERPADIVLPSGGGGGGQPQALQALMQMFKSSGDTADEGGGDSLSALAQLTSGGSGGPDTVIPRAGGGGETLPIRQATMALAPYAVDNARPGGLSSVEGVRPDMSARIEAMVQAMPPDVREQFLISSGFRDAQRQRDVNPRVKNSQHMHGAAVDLVSNPAVLNWINQNPQYGLGFPLQADPKERNHLEMIDPASGGRLPIMQAQYSPGGGGASGGVPGMPPVPNVPGVDPQAMNQLLIMLAQRNAAAEALGMGNPYGSLLSVLQGSPAYKGMIETATRGAGLPFVGPEAAAKAAGTFPYDMAGKQYEAALDRANKEVEMLGAARLDPAEILVDDGKGNKTIVQGTREQKTRAAYGLAVPELGIPGKFGPEAAAGGAPQAGSLASKPFVSEEDKLTLAQEAKLLEEKRGIADTSRQAIQSAHDTRKLIEKGIIAGGYADTRTQLLKFGQLLGLTGKNEDDLIRNTEAYIANQGKEMKAALQGLGPPISNIDVRVAEQLAGGQMNTIPGMLKILELREKYHRQAIGDYNTMAKQAPPSRYDRTVKAPPTYGAPVADGPNGPVWYNGKEWVPM